MPALPVEASERVRARLLVRMTQVGCAVDVIDGGREVELLGVRIGILGRHGRRHLFVSRAFLGILSRVLLVIFTFVFIVALAHLALIGASTRAELGYTPPIGTSDHFSYLRRRVPAITVGSTDVGLFHTTGDTTASVDPKRIRESGEVVVQALLETGASE